MVVSSTTIENGRIASYTARPASTPFAERGTTRHATITLVDTEIMLMISTE